VLKLTITSPVNDLRKKRRISVKRRLTPGDVVRELWRVALKSRAEGPTYMRGRAWLIAFVDEQGNDRYSVRIEGTPDERKLVEDLFPFPFEGFDAGPSKPSDG
jgi:hypothetical protein